ncbi:MAG TPA: ATP-dependent DNA helicase UvrD2 [Acidimicrobiales bacterium]|nr:ATP-dependent DNA helicase UvrD2 [Acidimicrobiales bacterium]
MVTDHTFAPAGSGEPDELLVGLDPAQHHAVTVDAHPLCILAGAGSGKTRVLTRRIAHRIRTGSALAPHVLALTFTRKAASELGRRLSALGVRDRVAAGTFHAIAYAQLRRRWADRGEWAPTLLDHKARLLVTLLPRRPGVDVGPAELATEIEWAKARLVTPPEYEEAVAAAGRRPPLPAGVVASIFARYEDEKRRRRLVDFDDLVLLCAEALESDARFAAGQRWRFRHLFVDEFQDVNPAQLRLLEGWLGDRADLCVVGDPDQAIYAWNGADPSALTRFPARFAGATVVHLAHTYRSSPQVVAVANAVLDGWRAPGARELRATRAAGAAPTVTAYAGEREEAAAVARRLRNEHTAGRSWSEMAVLGRTRGQLALLEESLRAAGVPFRLRGASSFLDRPAVRAAVADLAARPDHAPLATAIADLDDSPCGDDLEEFGRMMGEQLALDPAASVGGFLAWLQTAVPSEPAGDDDAVDLATFHASKGLEWQVVFVVGLEAGLVPVEHADTPEARAEERRLLYVAVTRAASQLHCSWAERRTFGTRTVARSPSPWLATVEAAVAALSGAAADVDWRRLLTDIRARVRAAPGGAVGPRLGERADPAVLAALRSWRANTARAAGVPAYVVLHDTTLAAVAEARPADHAALLALPGMGPVRVERYGQALLDVVAGVRASTG